jgi:hypothetical protein
MLPYVFLAAAELMDRTPVTGTRTVRRVKMADGNIRVGLLMVGNIALAGVSGEVFTLIHQHLRQDSPFRNTIMVTHANGSSGYIPNDAGFEQVSYEVTTSHLKPGCAENAIVGGFVEMMRQH